MYRSTHHTNTAKAQKKSKRKQRRDIVRSFRHHVRMISKVLTTK